MNKSTLLGLALAMLVPTVALADGVSIGGDLRLRWDYSSTGDAAGSNGTTAVTNFDLDAAINDNVSFSAQLRNGMTFGVDGGSGFLDVQEAYASIGNLGTATSILDGWSLEIGRQTKPTYGSGRVMNGDDWGFGAPENADGYHASSEMGGIGIDLYSWGGGSGSDAPAGSSNGTLGVVANFGDMGGFASISVGFWGYDRDDTVFDDGGTPGDTSDDTTTDVTAADNNMVINIDNIGGDNLMGVDLDVEWASSGADDVGDNAAADDGTMTTISASYALGDMGMTLHVSNSTTDEFWRSSVSDPHGTHGIADLVNGADIDNTTFGVSFSPMDGINATISHITLKEDSSGDDIGTETDIVLDWACGDIDMQIGYAAYSTGFSTGTPSDATDEDNNFFYLQTGWDF
jgi:hypothetical protein